MPARTEPVIETICGVGWSIMRRAGRAVAGDDVEHARRQELRGDLGQQQRDERRRVRRLEHDVLPAAIAGATFQTAMLSG